MIRLGLALIPDVRPAELDQQFLNSGAGKDKPEKKGKKKNKKRRSDWGERPNLRDRLRSPQRMVGRCS